MGNKCVGRRTSGQEKALLKTRSRSVKDAAVLNSQVILPCSLSAGVFRRSSKEPFPDRAAVSRKREKPPDGSAMSEVKRKSLRMIKRSGEPLPGTVSLYLVGKAAADV